MSPIVLLLVSLCLVSCAPVPLPSPSEQVIIEEPSGNITTLPLTQLSRGELLLMQTPGFRVGTVDEPIEIIPPTIGNWVDSSDPAIQATITTTTTSTNTSNTTTTTSTDEGVVANNPWSAMTGINVTIETEGNTTTTTTPSPTWIDVQSDRERRASHGAPRPAGFPSAPNITTTGTSWNITIHGNLTAFNLTAHNMTSNHSRIDGGLDGWSLTPIGGGGQTYLTGNLTGSRINMTVIAPNTTISIIANPNGTTTINTNTSIPTPTPTPGPSKPTDTNITQPSSAMLDEPLSWSLVISILLSSML